MDERQTRGVTIGGKCEGGEGRLRPVAAVPLLLEAALRLDKDGRAVDLAAPQTEGAPASARICAGLCVAGSAGLVSAA